MRSEKSLLFVILVLGAFLLMPREAHCQTVALKTNALYWATTTPNIGAEVGLGYRHTAQLFYGFNPWEPSSGKSQRHWVLQPEYRYWFCESFNGWFLGVHLMGGQFNVSDVKLPLGLFERLDGRRHEGWFAGGGVTAGYQWVLSRHWNFEASIGLGYDYIKYKKYRCGTCGKKLKSGDAHYVGPTKAALSVMYVF